MEHNARLKVDLIVIGAGLAGMAAACFAAARGLKVVQVSATGGELPFASGLLDVLGVYPPHEQRILDDPWAGIAHLSARSSRHPYLKLGVETIRDAVSEFAAILDEAGLPYRGLLDRNVVLATAAGTLKTTFRVPLSMWHGVRALREKVPALIVDFEGMKEFSGKLMVEVLRPRWPALRALRLPFPQRFMGVDRQNIQLAEAIESMEVRAELADSIRPHLAGAEFVGMPAILGLRSWNKVVSDLEDLLGVGIFEIPSLPPSVPGLRVREALAELLIRQGVEILTGRRVISVHTDNRGSCTGISVGARDWRETLEGEGVILASGRFLGGGLAADRNGIRETVFGFPVFQSADRECWHRERFFDPRGHPANEYGLEIDDGFRPLRAGGVPVFKNVFAAGSILAHQDWIRTKSGAGLAVATAYAAVQAFLSR